MNSVTMVCTVHEEMGLANPSELCAILERIRPEVIFLEVPPASFDDYYVVCRQKNLESKAVRTYRESAQVQLVPVDLPTPEREFFENFEYFRTRIREVSLEYRQLVDQDRAYVGRYGFAYLNSDYSSTFWTDLYGEMLNALGNLGDPRLVDIYESWTATNNLRDIAMITNIQNYCSDHSFNGGVFLVGAAHRQSIIDKSQGTTLQLVPDWVFRNPQSEQRS